MDKAFAAVAIRAGASAAFALAAFTVHGPPRGFGWLLVAPLAIWSSAGRRV